LHTTLTAFRKQRASGLLDSTQAAPKRIRATSQQRDQNAEQTRRVMQLERENRKLARQLEQAQAIIEVQKKVSRLLELSLDAPPEKSS